MSYASELMDRIATYVLDPIAYLLFALALLYFLWGLTVFIWRADDEEARSTGKRHMIWGLVGMLVIVGAAAIIAIIANTLHVSIP